MYISDHFIFSFDVRGGQGSDIGRHWNDGSLGARARFEEKAQPLPLLWIEDLRDQDQGTYRCRVDFKHAPTQNFQINLQVIGTYNVLDPFLVVFGYSQRARKFKKSPGKKLVKSN